ncbi:MAG: class I SAM-dependent methyltransferase [Nitrospiraceae bacterium]
MQNRPDNKFKEWLSAGFFTLPASLVLLFISSACAPHEERHQHRLPNVTEYLDRLDRPDRDVDQKPGEVVQALGLKPGMAIADLGSGSGYFTRRFIQAVTPGGTVYAIDVEPKALDYIRAHLSLPEKTASAVAFVHADADDPKLSPASVDLLFLCNTYHHIENRTRYFSRAAHAIRADGRLAVIDFYADHRSGDLGFPKDHLIARDQVIAELNRAGYRLAREHTFLPRQYFLEFDPPPSRN